MSRTFTKRPDYKSIVSILKNSDTWTYALGKIHARYGDISEDSIRGILRRGKSKNPYDVIHQLKSNEEDPHLITTKDILERKLRELKNERRVILDQLKETRIRANLVDDLSSTPVTQIKIKEPRSNLREGTAVILASDWHVEETIDPNTISHRNSYNMAIAKKRSEKFFSGIRWMLDYKRSAFTIRDVILWLGGDLISGYIHPELAEANEASPVEAILFVKNLISNGISFLLEDQKIENLYIPCSFGNHGRTTEKPRVQTAAENSFEWLLYNVLRDEWSHESRVHWIIDKSAHQYMDVYGKTLHFHHGDDLRYGGGVGGITIAINKRIPVWDRFKPAEVHNIGHWHQWLPLRRCVVNGSLIGYSPFSLRIGADYEDPVQAFYIFDSKRGKVEQTQIWVTDDS